MRWPCMGSEVDVSAVLFFWLEGDLLDQLLPAFLLHVQLRTEIPVIGMQRSDAKLRAVIFSFMLYLKILYLVAAEEIFQDHFCLVTAEIIAFPRQCNIYPGIKILCQLRSVTGL